MKKLRQILKKLGNLDEELQDCVVSELQKLRDRGVTYRELQSEINPAQVYKIMTGAYKPKMETLKKISPRDSGGGLNLFGSCYRRPTPQSGGW